jgi:hydrogenase nickel insertion protein HypA
MGAHAHVTMTGSPSARCRSSTLRVAFCFEAVVKGSIAEGATLDIVSVPGEAWCMPCGERVALARRGDPCPRCGSHQLQVVAGEEMRVKEIALA